MQFLSKILKSQSPLLKEAEKLVPKVQALEPGMQAKSDEELKALTGEFRERQIGRAHV